MEKVRNLRKSRKVADNVLKWMGTRLRKHGKHQSPDLAKPRILGPRLWSIPSVFSSKSRTLNMVHSGKTSPMGQEHPFWRLFLVFLAFWPLETSPCDPFLMSVRPTAPCTLVKKRVFSQFRAFGPCWALKHGISLFLMLKRDLPHRHTKGPSGTQK